MKSKWAALLLCCAVTVILLIRHFINPSPGEALYTDGQIRMEIQSMTSDAQPMKETTFQLKITEAGKPLTKAKLDLSITMPHMLCGVFLAVITETEPGVYRATAIPVMEGQWEAVAVLRSIQDRQIRVQTSFDVR